ncbi:hypothetical protein RABR111495_25185 [Rahnella bruchi]
MIFQTGQIKGPVAREIHLGGTQRHGISKNFQNKALAVKQCTLDNCVQVIGYAIVSHITLVDTKIIIKMINNYNVIFTCIRQVIRGMTICRFRQRKWHCNHNHARSGILQQNLESIV